MTVEGAEGRRLGYEIQISAIATGTVDQRTRVAREDALTPLWLVNNENPIPIDRAPWAGGVPPSGVAIRITPVRMASDRPAGPKLRSAA